MWTIIRALVCLCWFNFSADALSCGRSVEGRVVIHGGSPVEDQRKWPWMVSIQWKNSSKHFCSGTLIDTSWVLTAAHCMKDVNKGEVKLVFGSLNLDVQETSRFTRDISRVYIHPDFVFNSTRPLFVMNDIALIQMKGSVAFSSHVKPACLPDAHPLFYRECHAIGWGRTTVEGPVGGQLKDIFVRTKPASMCASAHPSMSSMIRHGNFICGLGWLAGGICPGDSGGPLLCKVGLSPNWVVVGVASWTAGHTCSVNEWPFGFAEVRHFLNWVKLINWRCPSGYEAPFSPSKSCYKFVKTGTNWGDAAYNKCQGDRAKLVSIETSEEQAHLANYMKSNTRISEGNWYWTSGTDMPQEGAREGSFLWQGTRSPASYTAFGRGQPDNENGVEHCVELKKELGWAWNDASCHNIWPGYICEKRVGAA